MSGRGYALLAAIVAIIIIMAVASMVLREGGQESPDDPGAQDPLQGLVVEGLPEGLSVDADKGTILSPVPVTWHVFDLYHTFYDTNAYGTFTDEYAGYDVKSDSLHLDVGGYRVTVDGKDFTATVYGDIPVSVSWGFDDGTEVLDASITYTIDFEAFRTACDASRLWNQEMNGSGSAEFVHLPDIVVTDDLTEQVEEALSAEFDRLGGDRDDPRAYLDFVASFVQENIAYPSSVHIGGGMAGWDYGLYGVDEYWAVPEETLFFLCGDCEDNSALLCALYMEAGYEVAMGGKSGHVFAGVAAGSLEPVSIEYLTSLGQQFMTFTARTAAGTDLGTVYYAVETIRGQCPVGYINFTQFGSQTFWGKTGFYPVSQGDESGIH